jgi:dihydrolipoamide dehydrogenase
MILSAPFGAHIVGPNADELIHECVLAIEAGIPVQKMADTIYVYPTLSESIKSAAVELAR